MKLRNTPALVFTRYKNVTVARSFTALQTGDKFAIIYV